MKKVNIAKMKIYGRGSRRSGGKAEVAQENKLLLLTIEKGNRDLEQMVDKISYTRSLGALRAPTSSWRPFGPLDFVLRALRDHFRTF